MSTKDKIEGPIILTGKEVTELVDLVDEPNTLAANRYIALKILRGEKNISDVEILSFMLSMLGFAVKNIIPEENYGDINFVIHTGDVASDGVYGLNASGDVLFNEFFNFNILKSHASEGNNFKLISALTTFGHELFHSYQYLRFRSEENSIENILYTTEKMFMSISDNFYTKMYDSLFFEFEADLYGCQVVTDYLKYLITFDNKISDSKLEKMNDELLQTYIEIAKPVVEMFNSDDGIARYLKILFDKIEEDGIMDSNSKFVLPDKCSNMLRNFFDENGKFSPTKAKLYCLWGSEESDSDQVLLESVLKLLCDKKKEKLKAKVHKRKR